MVARAGGCYMAAFKGAQGVTQGDLLPPTIFNVVVDAVVRHWVVVMVEGAEERRECGQKGRHKNSLFYADDVIVALLDPQWMKCAFSTLVGLFNWVGLQNNVGKTGGVRATDEGIGTLLPGASEGTGAAQIVRGGDGVWINGRAHEDTTWASIR